MSKAAHLLFYKTPEAKFAFSSLHIPDVRDSEKKDGDPGHPLEHLSRLRSECAITTLGSKPCQWQSKRRQDITDLKLQAIYETPLRPSVWENSVNESSKEFSIRKNVEQVCNSSPALPLWYTMTSRSCYTEIILWTQTAQRTRQQTTIQLSWV